MFNGKKAIFFIDGSNLYHSLKGHYGKTNCKFPTLIKNLAAQLQIDVVRVYYYNVIPHPSQGAEKTQATQRFLSAIEKQPFMEVKLGKLVKRGETFMEKGVDVRLATDMVAMGLNDRYEVAVLISGDADYKFAVQHVKDGGKSVVIAFPKSRALADDLRKACDVYISLEDPDYLEWIAKS